jgi:ketosteroid isomerase-like protein
MRQELKFAARSIQTDLVDGTGDGPLLAGHSCISLGQARTFVELFAKATSSRDPEVFAAGFTEDCVTWFPPQPELRCRSALRDFMAAGFVALGDDYICTKSLRTLSGNVLGVTSMSTWTNKRSGETMMGRGVEFWIMRDQQIARWDCSQTVWTVHA